MRKYTSPPSALGFWIALEMCTSENGALSFLPGSHLTAPIAKRLVRLPSGGTGFEQLIDPGYVSTPTGEYVMEECNPGKQSLRDALHIAYVFNIQPRRSCRHSWLRTS